MSLIWHMVWWIVLGAVVGWIVSLILGRDFKGGCLTYIFVGIITMFALGLVLSVLKLLWVLFLVAGVVVACAWLFDLIRGK